MRKWFVRGLVFFCLAGMALVAGLYQYWTNPESVRRQVIASLQNSFVNVHASLESARLRLFGGIEVKEVRLARQGDLDRADFLYVPSATIFHDKEQVLDGGLRLRKVEVRSPRMRIVREADGHWNLAGLFGPSDANRRLPTIVIRQGVLSFEDHAAGPGTPPLEIHDLCLTLINDPLPVVHFEGGGTCEPFGAVKVRGQAVRGGGPIGMTVEAPDLHLTPDLAQRVAGYCPEMAVHLRQLDVHATVNARLDWDSKAATPLRWSSKIDFRDGSFSHARLPWPLYKLHGSLACADGRMTLGHAEASAGDTNLSLDLRDVCLGPAFSGPATDRVAAVDLEVKHCLVDDNLFRYLPAGLQAYQQDYSPEGLASLKLEMRRLGSGLWRHSGTLTGEGMKGHYVHFRYPVENVYGSISWEVTNNLAVPSWTGMSTDWVSVDLHGEAAGKPVFIRGRAEGERGSANLRLDIWGNDVPIDDRLLGVLPPRPNHVARSFAPSGLLDFRVLLRRPRGQTEINKRFLLHLHDCTVCYRVFPLPLHDVSGTLDIQPDSWRFTDFAGKYNGGTIHASGHSYLMPTGPIVRVSYSPEAAARADAPEPTGPPSRVSVSIRGDNLPIDDGFKKALMPGREALVRAFDTFALTGRLNFAATIDDLPNQPRDIDVTVSIGGCRINPAFFPYPLEDVGATIRYANKRVWLTGMKGRHGNCLIRVPQGQVYLPETGGYWARLDRLEAIGLPLDAELRRAMPPGLGKLAGVMRPDKPVDVAAVLVVSQPPAEGVKPTVYWDAAVGVKDTTIQAGVEVTGVTGVVSSQGLHNGQQLEDVVGNVYLDRATVLNQPLTGVHLPLVIQKGSSDVLRMPGVSAELFGGTVSGEARVEFGSLLRYDLDLKATRVQLERLGKHNFPRTAELSGLANAALHVEGDGTELERLKGHGVVDVPSGRMYRLPLLLDLLKWLGLRLPDRTAFEQAHAEFRIEGPRLHVSALDLYGSAISVRGGGSMKLDGSDLKLDFNADWARLQQLLPPGLTAVTREVSNQLLRVKVRGKVGELKFEQELVPIVTDPLKKLWKSLAKGEPVNRPRGDRPYSETGRVTGRYP